MILFCIILIITLIYLIPMCICLFGINNFDNSLKKEIRKYAYIPIINVLFSLQLISFIGADKYSILNINFNGDPLNRQEYDVVKHVYLQDNLDIVIEVDINKKN